MKTFCLMVGVLLSANCIAGYNNNIRGVVSHVFTYPSGKILIRLENQPTSHPICDPAYFEIDTVNSSEAAVDRMLSRLLSAYVTKENLNIGYDDGTKAESTCVNGRVPVHRVG